MLANNTPTNPCKGADACNANIQCFEGDDNTATEYTSANSCDLVPLKYGYSQWRHSASIQCTDPATFSEATGYDNCVSIAGEWLTRTAYINADGPEFRTIGEKIAIAGVEGKEATDTEDAVVEVKAQEGSVQESEIQCLAANHRDVRYGSDNCWPFWLQGQSVVVGTDA
jgi:hypothetical protein